LKKNQLGKYIHKYIIAKNKSSKNVKITYNGFCGVIYAFYIYVPAFLDERKKKTFRTLHCMYKSRERERGKLNFSTVLAGKSGGGRSLPPLG